MDGVRASARCPIRASEGISGTLLGYEEEKMAKPVERVLIWPEVCRINGKLYRAGEVVVMGSVAEFEDCEQRTRCRFVTKREWGLRELAHREAQ